VLAASLQRIRSEQKSAALRARCSNVAEAATFRPLLLSGLTRPKEQCGGYAAADIVVTAEFAEVKTLIPTFVRLIAVETRELLCLDLNAAEAVRGSLDVAGAVRLAGTLKAFSDPTRLLIVQALAQRELCGCDLGWVTGQSDKVVSHHLVRLRRDGLVTSRRDGKVVFASLTDLGRVLLERAEALAI
jgi:ArsR family transcriptional regulator, lead/cadmium/zinc/bismuth-responsive transcriptional repressor